MAILAQQLTDNNVSRVGDITDLEVRQAQQISFSSDVTIDSIEIYFRNNEGSPTGQVTCRIETENAGEPSGVLVDANATKILSISGSSFNIFTFPASINLLSSTNYWIKLNCDDQSTDQRFVIGVGTPGSLYPDGIKAYSVDGSWTADVDNNFVFKINGTATVELITQETANNLGALGDQSNNEYRFSQPFILPAPATVTSFQLSIDSEAGGTVSGDVTIKIETDSGGDPTGTLVDANATATLTDVVAGWNTWNFTAPFELDSGTTYHIRAYCDNQSTDVRYLFDARNTGTLPNVSGFLYCTDGGAGTWVEAGSGALTMHLYGNFAGSPRSQSIIIV